MDGLLQDYFTEEYQPDLDWMCDKIVDTGERVTWAGRKGDFEEHLRMLETTFSGAPFICLYHAGIIVQIRRNVLMEKNVALFFRLWNEKGDVLRKHLSSRWLVSACDTILDVSPDPYERALALTGTVLINVAKLYESERYATGAKRKHLKERAGTVHLFDGVMRFSTGNGDMVSNMLDRTNTLVKEGSVAGQILLELFDRVQKHDTVFRRYAVLRKKMLRRRRLKAANKQGEKT